MKVHVCFYIIFLIEIMRKLTGIIFIIPKEFILTQKNILGLSIND